MSILTNSQEFTNCPLSPRNNQNNIQRTSPDLESSPSPKIQKSLTKKTLRPLEFYALGKLDLSHKHLPSFSPLRGFQSTSSDIFNRNLLSVNTRYYEDKQNEKVKPAVSIKDQNIKDNNYLDPFNPYKSFHKCNLSGNFANKETYNLYKKKLYAKDFDFSSIKKGRNVTLNEFYELKGNIIKSFNKGDNNSRNINCFSFEGDRINKINNTSTVINNSFSNMNENNNINTSNKIKVINDYYIKTEGNEKPSLSKISEISRSFSDLNKTVKNKNNNNIIFEFKDPTDYSKKELKSNNLHFDRNNKKFIRIRNWWKTDK